MSSLMRFIIAVLIVMVCFNQSFPIAVGSSSPDIDAYGKVVYVADGDTVDVVVYKIFDSKYNSFLNKRLRIRLADIDAPELYTVKGKLAKNFLLGLV